MTGQVTAVAKGELPDAATGAHVDVLNIRARYAQVVAVAVVTASSDWSPKSVKRNSCQRRSSRAPSLTWGRPQVHSRFCRMLYGLPVDSASVRGAPTLLVVGVPLYALSAPGTVEGGPALCAIVEHEVATLVQLPGVPWHSDCGTGECRRAGDWLLTVVQAFVPVTVVLTGSR